jgi:hypothetical protein
MKSWSYLHHNQQTALTDKNIQKMGDIIQKLAMDVRDAKDKLPDFDTKFKRRIATLWDAARLLRPLRIEREEIARATVEERRSALPNSQYLPPELRVYLTENFLSEGVVNEIEAIRDFFYEYFDFFLERY